MMQDSIAEKVLVSVQCLVYNHASYLRQCLDGFVMQKTSFKYEVIVHDDASTDGSSDIIREYAQKFPNIFKVIIQHQNVYSKGISPTKKYVLPLCTGKYIAMCEGDDYWTDPYKLQKQVDFLESHPDFTMCFHGATIKNETNTRVLTTCDKIETKEYFTKDIFPGWVVPTASVVYRREPIESYPPLKHQEWMKFGDIVLFLKCAHLGRVWGMSEKMSVYRMTDNGAVISQNDELEYFEKMCRHYDFLMLNFPQLDQAWPNEYIATYYYSKMRGANNVRTKIECLKQIVSHKPGYLITKLKEALKRRLGK